MTRQVSNFDLSRLTVAPLEISEVRCEASTWKVRRNHRSGSLVTFRGTYLSGSAGVDDARLIRWKLEQVYELFRPDGIVIDCRELEYNWGDDLHFPEREPDRTDNFPLLVVLRPDQQDAYSFAVSLENQRLDLLGALGELDQSLRRMCSLL